MVGNVNHEQSRFVGIFLWLKPCTFTYQLGRTEFSSFGSAEETRAAYPDLGREQFMGILVFLADDEQIRRKLVEVADRDWRFGFSNQFEVYLRESAADQIKQMHYQGSRFGGIYSREYISQQNILTRRSLVFNRNGILVLMEVPAEFEGIRLLLRSDSKESSLLSRSGAIHWMVRTILEPVDNSRTDSFYDRLRGLI